MRIRRRSPRTTVLAKLLLALLISITVQRPCFAFLYHSTLNLGRGACHGQCRQETSASLAPSFAEFTAIVGANHGAAVVESSIMSGFASTSTIQLAAETTTTESWRQYVPLAVSLLVITDILLGSPAANTLLSVIRPPEEGGTTNGGGGRGSAAAAPEKDLRERVDSMKVAQQALDKAAATTELRRFLDESKSDMEKMRDVQKKLDDQLRAFDEKQQDKK